MQLQSQVTLRRIVVQLTVGGTSSFTTSANNADITLNNTNTFAGAVALNTTGSTGNALVDNGTTALNVAAIIRWAET